MPWLVGGLVWLCAVVFIVRLMHYVAQRDAAVLLPRAPEPPIAFSSWRHGVSHDGSMSRATGRLIQHHRFRGTLS